MGRRAGAWKRLPNSTPNPHNPVPVKFRTFIVSIWKWFVVQVFPETETPKDVHDTARHKPKRFLKPNDRNPFSVSLCVPQIMLGGRGVPKPQSP